MLREKKNTPFIVSECLYVKRLLKKKIKITIPHFYLNMNTYE